MEVLQHFGRSLLWKKTLVKKEKKKKKREWRQPHVLEFLPRTGLLNRILEYNQLQNLPLMQFGGCQMALNTEEKEEEEDCVPQFAHRPEGLPWSAHLLKTHLRGINAEGTKAVFWGDGIGTLLPNPRIMSLLFRCSPHGGKHSNSFHSNPAKIYEKLPPASCQLGVPNS